MNATIDCPSDLQVVRQDHVIRITLNRPEKRNALSSQLVANLLSVLNQVEETPETRVVVLGANGPVFCSGHDLTELVGASDQQHHEIFTLCAQLMRKIRLLPQPVIASVNGVATAAGCQLVATCDLVVAAEEASFATPGVKIGLFCTTPMVPLTRAVPSKPALEMLLTGNPITALRAYELGLVNRVVPLSELEDTVQQFVDAIVSASPRVIAAGKKSFYDQLDLDESKAYEEATRIMIRCAQSTDAQHGIAAFLGKKSPAWD